MNIRSISRCLWITLLAFASAAGRADDIDIYVGSDQISGAPANVLIVMDNTANFASVAEKVTDANGNIVTNAFAEATAMKLALAALPENALNVGVMLYGGPRADSATFGGYPIYAIRPVNGDFRPTLEALLTKVQVEADANKPEYKGPASASYADLMDSVFRYFNGLESFNDLDSNNTGDETELRDFEGNKFPVLDGVKQRMDLTDYFGYTDSNTEKYQQPKQAKDGCARNVVIFVGNSTPSDDTNWDVLTERLKKSADMIGVTPQTTGIKEADSLKLFTPYWTQFMNTYGVKSSVQDAAGDYIWNKITTYTVDVCNVGCRGDVDGDGIIQVSEESLVDQAQRRLLRSMAAEGGGKYYKATNIQELTDNFKAIFAEIQAVNSAFASATLPISVNTQGTFENQVYIGVFRPDPNFGPRWQGNLKGYKFGRYCDANENGAVDFDAEITNFIPKTLDNKHTPTATDERIGEGIVGYVCNSTVNTGKVLQVALYLADKYGYPAIDQKLNTGFFDQSATSFWTTDSGSFWEFDAASTGNTKDIPDGPAVERGGAAQQVRLKWADPVADSRNVYTCLSCASGTDLTDPANAFKSTTANIGTYGPIQRPTTASRTITGITRVGTTATATYTGTALATGNEVEILGVTPSAYGGPVTLTAATATTFTYSVIETPLRNATASASGVTLIFDTPIKSSITLAGATIVGNTVELTGSVTLSGAGKAGLVDTDTPKIEGATQPFLNRAAALINNVGGTTTFNYRNKIVLAPTAVSYATRAAPTAGATSKAATTAGGLAAATAISIDKAYYLVASQKVVMRLASAINSNGNYATGNPVRITGAGWPYTKYGAASSDWTIADKGSACDSNIPNSDKNNWFCFTLPTTGLYTSPDPASPNINVSFTTLPNYAVTLTRAAGSDTVNATIPANRLPHTLTGLTSIKISGSQGVPGVDGYDGDWTIGADNIADPNDATFSFNIGAGQPITARGPVTPATLSSATATPDTAGPSTSNLFIWMRGKDLLDENRDAITAGARASIHGDVLHSRPAVVNYGSPGLYAFYGSNDGYLRGVKVGPDDATDAERGRESWAFIPEEFLEYSRLSRLYMTSPPVLYPNSTCSLTDPPELRNYYWDGPVAVYQSPTNVYYTSDINTVSATEAAALATGCVTAGTCKKRPEFTWLFAGMRRGGNTLYALDISNPAKPKFMWKVNPGTTYFDKLGQTWSEPKFVLLKHKATDACLVAAAADTAAQNACKQTLALVFGGGYDAATDDLPSGTARPEATTGYGVYVVKASDGSFITLLMPAGVTKRSASADVTTLDIDGDGFLDRIYAADTGAQLLRFDADTTKELSDASYWASYLVAKLGDLDGTAGGTDDRKFMQQPAVIPYVRDGVQGFNILIGSGNREKPIANKKPYSTLSQTSRSQTGGSSTLGCTTATTGYYVATGYFGAQIVDRFYSVLDTKAAPVSTITCDATCTALQEVNANPSDLKRFLFSSGKQGWFINLNYNPYQPTAYNGWEEKLVNSPKVEQGIVYFATNTPQKGETEKGICSNLGVALAYAIDPFTGLPAFNRNGDVYDGKAVYTAVDYAAKVAGGGLPPSVTSGTVKIGEEFYSAAIGTGGTKEESKSSQEGERTDFQISTRRNRVYWRYGAD
ncbi:MAG: hypothetical protein FIA96_05705 [Betaproteobacteria bacterium]|nr:hypothetical protein [Betaproteobacteria bacterium]